MYVLFEISRNFCVQFTLPFQVSLDVFNQHKDVIAFKNGALYHTTQPPTFGHGILEDMMVGQLEVEYPVDNITTSQCSNNLIFQYSNIPSFQKLPKFVTQALR